MTTLPTNHTDGTGEVIAAAIINTIATQVNANTAAIAAGSAPSGPAGGALAGTFPNPTLAAGVATGAALGSDVVKTSTALVGDVTGTVGATTIAANAVTTSKIAANSVTGAKLSGIIPTANLGSGTALSTTYLRGDSTWGAGTAGPLSGLTDATITSPADGNMLVYHAGSTNKWENDVQQSRTFEFFGGSLTGTLTAQTNAFNAFRTWADANGGGILVFGSGTYQHMPKMELGNHEGLTGQGFFATRLQFDASITTGSLIFNHVSTNGTTDANAYACSVENLTIDGTQLPGWGTNAVDGIVWDRNPRFGAAAAADSGELGTDCFHRIRNVFIKQTPRDGAVALAMGEQTWENVRVYNAGRYGFQPPFDSTIVNCCAGLTRQEGWFITGQPVKLIGCKAFSCGNDAATRANGQGFHIKNGPTALIGCEAQDNYAAGFWVDGVGANAPVTLTGCIADSNSVRGVGTDPGYDISNSAKTKLSGCVAQERRVDGTNSFQQHAVSLRVDSTGCTVDVSHMAVNGASVGTPFQAIGTGDVGTGSSASLLNVNNIQGFQSNSSASFSPDFFAGGVVETLGLATNATVGAPANGPYPKGARAEFIFQQDATGGRTITWNAIYVNTPSTNTTANAYTVARFRFDGTNWVGI